jgi:hypothetical protein
MKLTGMLHILLSLMLLYNFYSGFTTQEKELYARILDLIPIWCLLSKDALRGNGHLSSL